MTSDRLVVHTRVVTGAGGGPEKTIINSPRFLQHRGYPMLCAYMRAPEDAGFKALLTRAQKAGATILPSRRQRTAGLAYRPTFQDHL